MRNKVKVEGRRRLYKTVDSGTFMDSDPDNLVVEDFKSPPPLKRDKRPISKNTGRAEDSIVLDGPVSKFKLVEMRNKVKVEGRRRLYKTVDSGTFMDSDPDNLVVEDFKSPPPLKRDKRPISKNTGRAEDSIVLDGPVSKFKLVEMRNKVKVEGRRRLYKTVDSGTFMDSDPDNLVVEDFKSPPPLKRDKRPISKNTGRAEDSIVLDGPVSKFKLVEMRNKVKVEGRRRLYKTVDSGTFMDSDPDNLVVEDFKSPPPLKRDKRPISKNTGRAEDSIVLDGPVSKFKLVGNIAKMLYPHQRDGLEWLWSLHCEGKGGILGDDMGLGKTMQICGFLAGLFYSRLIKRVLIVAPKTLLPHWIKELSAVGLSQNTRKYYGTSAKARQDELHSVFQDKGILLTTYDIVRNNDKSLRGDYFDDKNVGAWDYMILDEGHLIKNPGTQRAKSLLEIPAAHRIIISGTPIQNHLQEMWALFSFCCPELLGDRKWFKDKYENAILRGIDKNASDRDKRIGSATAKKLREHIQPYFLHRLKSEVRASLPQKHELIVWLRLTTCQRQIYRAFINKELVVSDFDKVALAALTTLKTICDHPLLLAKRADGVAEIVEMHTADVTERLDLSCKISFILSLLPRLIPSGHNVLIFSRTRNMLDLIQDSLRCNNYNFLRIDGTTKADDRLKIVDDFQAGGAPIFLLTSQVGGLGLTLTKADRVIVVDPAWNPSTDNQSVDRAYRIGQKKDVLVYRLITCGTIEEKIYRKQVFKGGLFRSATDHKDHIRYFGQEDFRGLISIPEEGFEVSLTQQQLHEEHAGQLKMKKSLKKHLEFVESLGIAGVSHHSLLFSKTANVEAVQEEEIASSGKAYRFVSSSGSSVKRDTDGAKFAFNPKDVKLHTKVSSSNNSCSPSESARDIEMQIQRYSQALADKRTISRLPDKGDKLREKIDVLRLALLEAKSKNGDISGEEKACRFVSSSGSSVKRDTDGAKFAFNPKDVKLHTKVSSSNNSCSPSESARDIEMQIQRYSQALADKRTISKLSDKGDKLREKIDVLRLALLEAKSKNGDISGEEKACRFVSSSGSSVKRDTDGAKFAFNPKDVKLHTKVSSSNNSCSPSESARDIEMQIQRYSQALADKRTISKLSDKGDKLRGKIDVLRLALLEAKSKNGDISGEEKACRFVSSSGSSVKRDTDGAKFAFNPKDVKLHTKVSSSNNSCSPSESARDIEMQIQRYSQALADKRTISKLSDKGDKLREKIDVLRLALLEAKSKNGDISGSS